MIKIALVDDHTLVRSGFSQLLNLEDDMQVVCSFGSAKEARQKLPKLKKVDICILDISMPDESGLALLKDLVQDFTCIMLSGNDSELVVKQALEYGAKGFLTKRCSRDELIQAVRTVHLGGCYLLLEIATSLFSPYKRNALDALTKRELQVCQLLVAGQDVKQIGETLGLSFKTVHVHRANSMSKLNVKNNVELANLYINIFNNIYYKRSEKDKNLQKIGLFRPLVCLPFTHFSVFLIRKSSFL